MRPHAKLISALLLSAGIAGAQTRLHLKFQAMSESGQEARVARQAEPVRRSVNAREHLLLEFEEGATAEALQELERRDVRYVQYVPDGGFIFSARRGQDWEGLRVRARRFLPREKISRSLIPLQARGEAGGYAIAEFFPDVDRFEVMNLAGAEGFQIVEHPDLLPNHLLLRGPLERLESLASHDEVAYLFPASEDLTTGQRVVACPGALTAFGTVGQYVAAVGEGWDGPGKGKAALGYFLQRLTRKLPEDATAREILRAMQEWSRHVEITFSPVPGANYSRTIAVLFASGSHGDAHPFDGPGRVLAHTFYPSPPNPETIAGDMHLDEDEEWVVGPDFSLGSVDVFSVVLHELGHALGLGHADDPGSVMYPYYRRVSGLTATDILAIRELYAARAAQEGGLPDPGSPSGGQPPAEPLAVLIGSPASFPVTTTALSLALSGTVTGGAGNVQVSWSSDRGGTGTASGGRSWSISSLPLLPGVNNITLTVRDEQASTASRTVQVNRTVVADTTAPTIKITSPAASTVLTSSASIRLAGTASDNVGVSVVTWSSSNGKAGSATGTTQWTAEVPLLPGANTILVRAYDAAGNSSWRSISVTRR